MAIFVMIRDCSPGYIFLYNRTIRADIKALYIQFEIYHDDGSFVNEMEKYTKKNKKTVNLAVSQKLNQLYKEKVEIALKISKINSSLKVLK